ncbi:hypothetical protein AGIG_G15894 [Arapaima gigas]
MVQEKEGSGYTPLLFYPSHFPGFVYKPGLCDWLQSFSYDNDGLCGCLAGGPGQMQGKSVGGKKCAFVRPHMGQWSAGRSSYPL